MTPYVLLVHFFSVQVSVAEGEELTLLNNSATQTWLVRNIHAIEAHLPSVICVIPGPDPAAVRAANRCAQTRFLKQINSCCTNID